MNEFRYALAAQAAQRRSTLKAGGKKKKADIAEENGCIATRAVQWNSKLQSKRREEQRTIACLNVTTLLRLGQTGEQSTDMKLGLNEESGTIVWLNSPQLVSHSFAR